MNLKILAAAKMLGLGRNLISTGQSITEMEKIYDFYSPGESKLTTLRSLVTFYGIPEEDPRLIRHFKRKELVRRGKKKMY